MFDENISILIPFKSDGGQREKNWNWLKKRYELLMPNAELCIGDSDIEPYCRSAAINNAAKLATKDIFIIADADMVFDINQIKTGIEMLSQHAWVIPFTITAFLTVEQTNSLLQKDPAIIMSNIDFAGCRYFMNSVSEVNILPRKHFEKIGGFDERFKGWGFEDMAFQSAMDNLCGAFKRIEDAKVWHLYHPPASEAYYSQNASLFYNNYAGLSNNKS